MAKPVILYWYIDRPTDDDRTRAAAVGAKLRNVAAYRKGDCIEVCDGVMGFAPSAYVERFGRIREPNSIVVELPVALREPIVVGPVTGIGQAASFSPAPCTAAFCLHIGGGQWEITDRSGNKLPETYARSTAYAKVRAMNGES